eukprot:Skav224189  [mRNA]  locus=scaffold1975:367869:368966:+ [translate_table: standard]
MLPEIRSEKVIASWSIKFYTAARKPVDHREAVYAHGYFKIPATMLEQTLKRSGMSGVFMQSKLDNKKPDPNYGIIPLHGYNHEDALAMTQKIPQALGIIIMNDQTFAVRARREHVLAVRKLALPQSISAQEGSITPGAKWFILKGLKTSTDCQHLTDALKGIGWEDAVAIRPKGPQAWLVCAQTDPPSLHVQVNDYYASIVPIGFKIARENPKTKGKDTNEAQITANFSLCPEESEDSVSTASNAASRFQDLKVGLQDQINSMINEKFVQYDTKLQTIQDVVQQNKLDSDKKQDKLQADVEDIQKNQISIQTQIADSNTSVVTQMQSLFQQMQENFNTKIDAMKADDSKDGNEPKRQKTEGRAES